MTIIVVSLILVFHFDSSWFPLPGFYLPPLGYFLITLISFPRESAKSMVTLLTVGSSAV